ncbi:MAG: xanthine dehydrogenase accessory protein XdhC [Oceanospirillaceae bacterium]
MNRHWSKILDQCQQQGEACVLVTIFSTKGSTPRESGSKMLVTQQQSFASIGGGHLEHRAIKLARNMLKEQNSQAFIDSFSLGPSLGQCCGGSVELLFEAFYPPQHNIVVFGAGHIANALIPILGQLPCSVTWIDSRAALFTGATADNTHTIISDDVLCEVANIPRNSYVLVMTHNHQLDQSLCESLLNRQDCSFIGVIGSQTKQKKFKLRLKHKNFTPQQVDSICCPIGLSSMSGKLPMEIAVSVSAQFINFYQSQTTENSTLTNNLHSPAVHHPFIKLNS